MPVNTKVAQDQWLRFRWNAENGHYKFIKKADMCDKFFIGEQWDENDLQLLKAQRRPALTINKIISTVATIMGEQIYNRSEVLYRPAAGADAKTADAMSKVWMQISQNNQLPWIRSDIFADGIIRSRGFYDVRLDFNDSMQGEVRITNLNSKNVVIDPDAEDYDPDTWNDVFITKWLTIEDIALLYSEEDAKILAGTMSGLEPYSYDSLEQYRDTFGGTGLDNDRYAYTGLNDEAARRNVRVLERQHRVLTTQKHFVDVVTGDTRPVPDNWDQAKINKVIELSGNTIKVIKKKVKRIRWTVTADSVVLHDDWSPYKHFTVVPFFPYFIHGQTVGIVENLISSQELLNKASSQELHVINTTANSGWKLKTGALQNMTIEELEISGSQTGLVLELDEVANAEKITPNSVPSGLDRVSSKAEEHIKTISNVSDSMQGFDREDVAAKAIAYKQQRGSINLTKVIDNLERTDWILARNVTDLIQSYYSEERVIKITNDDVTRASEEIVVNRYDPEQGKYINDLTMGEYTLVVTSTPFRASMEDSQFEQALALRELGVPIPDSVLIENSRMQRRSEILEEIQSEANSEAAIAAAELDRRTKEAEAAKLEAEVNDKAADVQLKQARAATEMQQAQLDPEAEAQRKHQLEMFKLQQEFNLKQAAQAEEFRLRQMEHEQKMALQAAESAARMKEAQRAARAKKAQQTEEPQP